VQLRKEHVMRTRANGQELTVDGVLEDLRKLWSETRRTTSDYLELEKDLRSLLQVEKSRAFDEGIQLGARVEHRYAVQAVATAALHVLGKDVGDGEINLGSLGTWWPSFDMALGPKDQEGEFPR
jgi:hypothetical protein